MVTPEIHVRTADDIDHVELLLTPEVFRRAHPLLHRLRYRTLGRGGYEALVSILVENAILTGQPDETAFVLRVIGWHWMFCPFRYVPWPPRTLARPRPQAQLRKIVAERRA